MPLYCWSLISGQAVPPPPPPAISDHFSPIPRTKESNNRLPETLLLPDFSSKTTCLRKNHQRFGEFLPATHNFPSQPKNSVGVTHKDGESAIREISIDDARGRMIFSLSSPLETDVWMWGYRKLPSSSLSPSSWKETASHADYHEHKSIYLKWIFEKIGHSSSDLVPSLEIS